MLKNLLTYAVLPALFCDTVSNTALEYTASFKFFGADKGVFPASTANTATSQKLNSLQAIGGEESRDFKAGMDTHSLMRFVGQSSGVRGTLNLNNPSSFLKKFQTEGPLCEVTVTGTNQTDSTTQIYVLKGKMKVPDFEFLGNPGTVDFEIEAYGNAPTITIP